MDKVLAQSSNPEAEFESSEVLTHIASEIVRRQNRQDTWSEEDARNVLQGAERCDIILRLARGLDAKSLARSRYQPIHKKPGFKEMWAKAEREEDEDRMAELVKLIEDKFSQDMDECTSIVFGPSGDGYASCANLIQ